MNAQRQHFYREMAAVSFSGGVKVTLFVCGNRFKIFLVQFLILAHLVQLTSGTAKAFPGGGGGGGFTATVGTTPALNDQLNNLISQVGILNQNLATSNGNWTVTNGQIAQGNQNWQQTNAQLSGINQNWAQTNQDIANVLNPAHALLYGAALGVGMAIGGALISAAILVIQKTAQAAYEAWTHAKRDAKLLEQFKEAYEQYFKINPEIEKISERIDSYAYVESEIQKAGSKENLIVELDSKILKLYTIRDAAHELEVNLRKQQSIENLVQFEANKLNELGAANMGSIRKYESLRDTLEKLPRRNLCDQMKEDVKLLVWAQGDLQTHRAKLLDPRSQNAWDDAWKKEFKQNSEMFKRGRDEKLYDHLLEKRKRAANKRYQTLLDSNSDLKKSIQNAWFTCMAVEGSRLAHYKGLRWLGFANKLEKRNQCWAEATNPDSAYSTAYSSDLRSMQSAKEQTVSRIENEQSQFSQAETPLLNSELNEMNLQEYYAFFQQMREDQSRDEITKVLELLKSKQKKVAQLCEAS